MNFHSGITQFADGIKSGYSKTALTKYPTGGSIYATLYYCCVLHCLKDKPERIKSLVEPLASRTINGLLCEEADQIGKKHDSEYVSLHLSAIFYQLLAIYGEDYAPIEKIRLVTSADLREMLDKLNFNNAWHVSNIIMSYAVLFAFNNKKGYNHGALEIILELLLQKQNKVSGLWDSQKNASLINGMAATFHYLPLFAFLNRPVPHGKEMFNAVSDLVNFKGHFSSPAGYVCIDYDGIAILKYLLATSIPASEYRSFSERLVRIAKKLRVSILRQQQNDGGFPEVGKLENAAFSVFDATFSFFRNRCVRSFAWNMRFIVRTMLIPTKPLTANSVKGCVARMNESNMFSTWFRYLTISICEDIISSTEPFERVTAADNQFTLPGLNYL